MALAVLAPLPLAVVKPVPEPGDEDGYVLVPDSTALLLPVDVSRVSLLNVTAEDGDKAGEEDEDIAEMGSDGVAGVSMLLLLLLL